jgi:hypothetical protein
VRSENPEAAAWAFHETLLEVLRRLNQSAERRGDIEGLEFVELERVLAKSWAVRVSDEQVESAVSLLMENGLVRSEAEPRYAWDRRRVLGERFAITPLGKAYLLRAIGETERIR